MSPGSRRTTFSMRVPRGGRQREGTYFVIFIVRTIIAHRCTVAAVLPADPNLAPREEEEMSWLRGKSWCCNTRSEPLKPRFNIH